jgi:hypothetical protein
MTTLVSIGKDARWKLTPADHREIRQLGRMGVSSGILARVFKVVTDRQIRKIIDLKNTSDYWSKKTAEQNLWRYHHEPKYKKRISAVKIAVYQKRKKLNI